MDKYALLDTGDLKKLEQFGPVSLIRPCPVAIWSPEQPANLWQNADASFTRETDNFWHKMNPNVTSWKVNHGGMQFQLALKDFGGVGLFPEHESHWPWMEEQISRGKKTKREQIFVLNLFAYTGGASFACAKAGACVCHLDASRPAVSWARENAALNQLSAAPIRWIVDDAMEFAKRELKRDRKYDGIIIDPPSFGRGPDGQLFKIEQHLPQLIDVCLDLLSDTPLFLLLTCHTPGYTSLVLHHLLSQKFKDWEGTLEAAEMTIPSKGPYALPSGSFARWYSAL